MKMVSLLSRIMHDVRLVSAVWHPLTGRFGPDLRDFQAIGPTGKILSNIFSMSTAVVTDGDKIAVVRIRSAARAAALLAIRRCRLGDIPQHSYEIRITNARGMARNENVFIGFDTGAVVRDSLVGDERGGYANGVLKSGQSAHYAIDYK